MILHYLFICHFVYGFFNYLVYLVLFNSSYFHNNVYFISLSL